MTNPEMIARRLRLPGTQNVRDIGGYPTSDGGWTRWGLLLRGDSLQEVDDEGLTRLADYGLRTVIDLRTAAERRAYADRLPLGVRLVAAPLLDSLSDGRSADQSVQDRRRLPGCLTSRTGTATSWTSGANASPVQSLSSRGRRSAGPGPLHGG